MFPWWIYCKGSYIDIIEDSKVITGALLVLLVASIAMLSYVVYVAFFR